MLIKFFLFSILWRATGNPFLALLVLLVIFYVIDRRYVGITPNIFKPFQLQRRMNRVKDELRSNPHHTSAKLELARILIERKRYGEALTYLEQIINFMDDSADVNFELGLCYLKLGELEKGEPFLWKALDINPRIKYGEPYLRLGEAYALVNPQKAVTLLEQFKEMHSSSCEAYYRLGQLYQQLGRTEEAKRAYRETLHIYKSLPSYSKRQQRRWAILARLKG